MRLILFLSFSCFIGNAFGSTIRLKSHLLGAKECTWGPSYWCQNLTTSSQCRATKHCIQTTWIHQKLPEDLSSVCQTCLEMVKEARDQLLSNETQEEIKEVFEGSCKLLPVKVISKECCKLADEFIPDLVDTLASQMDPQVVCSVAGLCNNERVRRLLEETDAAIIQVPSKKYNSCTGCFEVVKRMERNLRSANAQEIENKYLGLCREMGSYSEACSNFVIKYFDDIYEYILNNLNPQDFCHMAGECTSKFHIHGDVGLTSLSKVDVVGDDLPCDFCKQLVKHLQEILIGNTTKAEFHLVLTGICKQTRSFKDECLNLVDEYYSNIYDFLVQELNGTVLCTIVDICPGPGLMEIENDLPIQPLLPVETVQKQQVKTQMKSPELMQLPIERVMPQTLTMIGDTKLCVFCEYFLHFVQQVITDPKTEDNIRHVVDKACDRLPSSINDTCRQFVDTYGPAFVAILAQDIDPSQVCPKLSLCPAQQEVSDVELFMKHNTGNKANCPLCLFAITSLEEYVKNNNTESNIRKELSQLCSHLNDNIKKECVEFVNTYTEQIVETCLADFTPAEVCEFLKLCKDKTPVKKVATKIDYPSRDLFVSLNSPLVETLDNIEFQKIEPKIQYGGDIETNEIPDFTSNGQIVSSTVGSQVCVLCEFVMSQIKQELKENSTEQEIKHIVHNVCERLPKSVVQECDDFVNQYADLVIQLLIQDLEPNQICVDLKLCQPTINIVENLRSPQCSLCKVVMKEIEHLLQGKVTEDEIIKAVHNACYYLPSHQRTECNDFIDKNGKRIIELLEIAIEPAEICSLLMFC